jgi:hypothetical protein
MTYAGYTVFSPNAAKPDPGRTMKSVGKGAHTGRVAFRIEGGIHSIGECVDRTGMTAEDFRKSYNKVSKRKTFGWDDFK